MVDKFGISEYYGDASDSTTYKDIIYNVSKNGGGIIAYLY